MIQNIADAASAAFQLSTRGRIARAHPWQARLYDRLSSHDSEAGYLLISETGAGRTDAVVIPSLGVRRGGAPRRLFIIAADGSTLDDYVYRLVPYLRAWAIADESQRTLYLGNSQIAEHHPCWRFFPDGTEDRTILLNPLEADVDLVLTTFSQFPELFFGGGHVHGLPSALEPVDAESYRRDLFFFDEAHAYSLDLFSRFLKLVEFLFAGDTDIVVGSSTMPESFAEELSFLERVAPPIADNEPARDLTFVTTDPLQVMETAVKEALASDTRTICAVEDARAAVALHERLAGDGVAPVALYHENQPDNERRAIYAWLKEWEDAGKTYTAITTGTALETSDLDAALLVTTFCPPERLILRAGRCNRRGLLESGRIVVAGDRLADSARALNAAQLAGYRAALAQCKNTPFDPHVWKAFV